MQTLQSRYDALLAESDRLSRDPNVTDTTRWFNLQHDIWALRAQLDKIPAGYKPLSLDALRNDRWEEFGTR